MDTDQRVYYSMFFAGVNQGNEADRHYRPGSAYGPSSGLRTITRASPELPAASVATAQIVCHVPGLSAAVLQRIV